MDRAGAVTTVREARLAIAGAALSGGGRHDAAARRLAVEALSCNLNLAALGRALPALVRVPAALAGARVHAAVSLDGNPDDLGAAHLHLASLDVAAPFGHLRGTVDLDSVTAPKRVTFDLDGDALDLDAIGGGDASRAAPALPLELEAHGTLRLGRLHARALDARDLTAEVALDHGALRLPKLRFSAFGGTVIGDGSSLEMGRGVPAFGLRVRAERLDLASLAAGRDVTGRLDADVALDGAGIDWASIAPTLDGTVRLALEGVHVHTVHTVRGTVINPLLGEIAERFKKKHPVREVDMRVDRADVALRAGGGKNHHHLAPRRGHGGRDGDDGRHRRLRQEPRALGLGRDPGGRDREALLGQARALRARDGEGARHRHVGRAQGRARRSARDGEVAPRRRGARHREEDRARAGEMRAPAVRAVRAYVARPRPGVGARAAAFAGVTTRASARTRSATGWGSYWSCWRCTSATIRAGKRA